jgi:hypothetical protein
MASLYYILWTAPHICLGVSIFFLLKRGVHRQLPLFCAYTGCLMLEYIVLMVVGFLAPRVSSSPLRFYRSFAIACMVLSFTLEFLAIFELTKELTLPRELVGKLVPIFRWAAAALVLSAALLSARFLGNGGGELMAAFETVQFSANLVKLGLLLVLLVCTIALKISWKSLPAGLALGFGIQSSAEMGASALYSALDPLFGKPGLLRIDMIGMVAFLFCTIIWLVYIVRPEKTFEFKGKGLPLSELELLDQQMQKLMRPEV